MAIVITQPITSTSGIVGTTKRNIVIPGNSSDIVDSFSSSKYKAVKWIYHIEDNTNNKSSTGEILVSVTSTGDVMHNRYAVIGTSIPYLVNVNNNSGTIELSITNNQSDDLSISVVRINVV